MSRTFTKLFSSITASTIWAEPDHTRILWVTMLAMADQHGRVWASIPGLANMARIAIDKCEDSLKSLSSPDRYSRTKDHEGRRIEEIDGGWRLLNHAKYREIRDEESIKESKRKYINARRAAERMQPKEGQKGVDKCRTPMSTVDIRRANTEADTDTEADTEVKRNTGTRAKALALNVSDLVKEGVDPQHAADWFMTRGKSKLTATYWNRVKAQAAIAGISAAEAVRHSAENGWIGFKADWIKKSQGSQMTAAARASSTAAVARMLGIGDVIDV